MAYNQKQVEQAFELWRKGSGLIAISKEPNMPCASTLNEWKKKFNWAERKAKIQEKTLQKADTNRSEMDAKMIKILEGNLAVLVEQIKSGKQVKSPTPYRDIVELIRATREI